MIYKIVVEKIAFVEADSRDEAEELYWDGFDIFNESECIKKVIKVVNENGIDED